MTSPASPTTLKNPNDMEDWLSFLDDADSDPNQKLSDFLNQAAQGEEMTKHGTHFFIFCWLFI